MGQWQLWSNSGLFLLDITNDLGWQSVWGCRYGETKWKKQVKNQICSESDYYNGVCELKLYVVWHYIRIYIRVNRFKLYDRKDFGKMIQRKSKVSNWMLKYFLCSSTAIHNEKLRLNSFYETDKDKMQCSSHRQERRENTVDSRTWPQHYSLTETNITQWIQSSKLASPATNTEVRPWLAYKS